MSGNERQHLKDEGSKTQVILAGGIAGLVARYAIDTARALFVY
jgi:hypothetical protein